MYLCRRLMVCAAAFLVPLSVLSQQQKFKLSSPGDYIATGILIPAVIGGNILYNHKQSLSIESVQLLDINNINRFDRSAAKHYSHTSAKASDYLLGGFLVAPAALFIDDRMNDDPVVKSVIYIQTLALTGAEVSWVKGLINRARPFVYNTSAPVTEKIKPDANCSFFSGHTAMTAASTFYMASLITETYGPRYDWTWFAAAFPPLLTGYFRYSAGKHFFTDILAGLIVGSVNGYLVSELHKSHSK